MTPAEIALWTALGVALVIAVATDLLRQFIPTALTAVLLFGALALRLLLEGVGSLDSGLLSGVVAAAGLALVLLPFTRGGGMGAGDVRLMAGVGAAVGFPAVLAVAGFVSLMAFFQAVVTLLWQGAVAETLGAMLQRWAVRAGLRPEGSAAPVRRRVPFSVAVLLGCAWTWVWRSGRVG
ncbi:prepilin peptidase [Aggregicoccus sp. 17bor-14]|uniref:prepilin peptidase n=1 Tax=Myxococcaceae TaxID=31 RepID=UPI00129C32CA|nr:MULTISPECIES: prepilin peptidase [Myxococcaceae]MBF5041160.1 prepilin peptidase [Simulacricoccus sp. 17bor-14]MRI86947.1 prepilin peptidase [Aggregicoccus sp. 17bor-14]